MNIVKLHSLNIQVEELIPLIYHQTGRQFRWQHAATNNKKLEEFAKKFFEAIKDLTFQVENLFEPDENVIGNMFSTKEQNIQNNDKRTYNMIGVMANRGVKFTYVPKIPELKKLLNARPELYKWLKPQLNLPIGENNIAELASPGVKEDEQAI